MKRAAALLLLITLLFTGCAAPGGMPDTSPAPADATPPAALTADAIACAVIAACGREGDALRSVAAAYTGADLAAYIQNFYGLGADQWADCAIYLCEDASDAFEVAVFRLEPGTAPGPVQAALESYRDAREGDYFGYNPEQAAIIADSVTLVTEDCRYAAVLICEDASAAREAFYAALEMEAPAQTPPPEAEQDYSITEDWQPYTDPDIDDMTIYDTAAILRAWEIGDPADLSEKDAAVYARCTEVIAEVISDGMTDLEKELAIYTWLTANVRYDQRHYQPDADMPRESYEPYGAVIDGRAVCLGAASAFQLFMDMLGIECITVIGAAYNSTEDHAWNMVRLDGEWTCADVTWDLGVRGLQEDFCYFNVTSQYLAFTGHQWEYTAYPLTEGSDMRMEDLYASVMG